MSPARVHLTAALCLLVQGAMLLVPQGTSLCVRRLAESLTVACESEPRPSACCCCAEPDQSPEGCQPPIDAPAPTDAPAGCPGSGGGVCCVYLPVIDRPGLPAPDAAAFGADLATRRDLPAPVWASLAIIEPVDAFALCGPEPGRIADGPSARTSDPLRQLGSIRLLI